MIALALIPMAVCLVAAFAGVGVYLVRRWTTPNVFFPKTILTLKHRMLQDKTGRYLYDRYATWLSVAQIRGTPEAFLLLSLGGAAAGFAAGILLGNILVSFSLFVLMLLAPSLLLYARYLVRKGRMIKSFSKFVDLFTRYYSSRRNAILAFREMVDECPKDLLPELILLNNSLTDGGNPSAAVEQFAERLNHDWAHDFATYVISGLEGETEDVQSSLNRLTTEMFVQQDEKEERRSEIYGIWISLIIVIIICLLFIPYNQTLLGDSYRLYFLTPDGQALLSLAVTVWGLSILFAFIWGRRNG